MKRQKRQSNHRSYLALACLLWTALLLTVYALAANLTLSAVAGLSASYDKGTWSADGTTITGSVKTTSSSGCSGTTYSNVTGTLTLTNNSGKDAILSFDYSLELNEGSASVNGNNASEKTAFSGKVGAGNSVTVNITSSSTAANETTIKISNIKLVADETRSLTFNAAAGGTITVAGETVTTTKTVSATYADGVAVTAAPASGYTFYGWLDDSDNVISTTANDTIKPTTNMTLHALFFKAGSQSIWGVGKKVFGDLNSATTAANSATSKTVVLLANGTLPSGAYTIPNGVTVLIPFDDVATMYRTAPGMLNNGSRTGVSTPSVFRKLTLASGASITVNGSISVSAKVNANNTSYSGVTCGKFGQIICNSGSSITINENAALYCWGYITGGGSINVLNGGVVYEPFQICDLRGGSATSAIGIYNKGKRVFPFSQYYVQNIETSMTLNYGAKEYVIGSFNIAGADQPSVLFVGTDGAMFNLTSNSSTLVKTYVPAEDRLRLDVSGNATLDSISVYVDSNDFNLPIMENMSLHFSGGITSVNQDLCIIPGAEVLIDSDATLSISSGHRVIVYDRDEWVKSGTEGAVANGFIYSKSNFKNSYYSPTRKNADKFVTADMLDVLVDINGKIVSNTNASYGFYTTSSGANITSTEGTGKVQFTNGAANDLTTYQYDQGSAANFVSISAVSAKLHNGNGSYTATAGASANDEFSYCATCDMWKKKPHSHDSASYNVTISWPELKFTYTRSTSTTYTWDGEGKKYKSETSDSGSWTDNSKNIKVLNTSSAGDVNAQFNFTAQTGLHWTEAPSMAFTCGEATVTAPIPVPVTTDDKGTTVTATLSGTPAADFTEKQIGTITVTITAAQGG